MWVTVGADGVVTPSLWVTVGADRVVTPSLWVTVGAHGVVSPSLWVTVGTRGSVGKIVLLYGILEHGDYVPDQVVRWGLRWFGGGG